jgi:hypothetical protein
METVYLTRKNKKTKLFRQNRVRQVSKKGSLSVRRKLYPFIIHMKHNINRDFFTLDPNKPMTSASFVSTI